MNTRLGHGRVLGFTLIELLVVLSILGILVALTVPSLRTTIINNLKRVFIQPVQIPTRNDWQAYYLVFRDGVLRRVEGLAPGSDEDGT